MDYAFFGGKRTSDPYVLVKLGANVRATTPKYKVESQTFIREAVAVPLVYPTFLSSMVISLVDKDTLKSDDIFG